MTNLVPVLISTTVMGSNIYLNGNVLIEAKSEDRARQISARINHAIEDNSIYLLHQDNHKMHVMTNQVTLFTASDLKEKPANEEEWMRRSFKILPPLILAEGMPTHIERENSEMRRLENNLNGSFIPSLPRPFGIPYSWMQDIAHVQETRFELANLYYLGKSFDSPAPVLAKEILEIFGQKDHSWKQFFVNATIKDPNKDYLQFKPNADSEIRKKIINPLTRQKMLDVVHRYALYQCDQIMRLERINPDYFYEALFLKGRIYAEQAKNREPKKFDEAIKLLNVVVNPSDKHSSLGYKLRALRELGDVHLLKFGNGLIPDSNGDKTIDEKEEIAYIKKIGSYYEWALELCADKRIPENIQSLYGEHGIKHFAGMAFRKSSGEIFEAIKIMLALGDLYLMASRELASPKEKQNFAGLAKGWYNLAINSLQFKQRFIYKTLQKPEYFFGYKAQAYLSLSGLSMAGQNKGKFNEAVADIMNASDLIDRIKMNDPGYFYYQNYFERRIYFEVKNTLISSLNKILIDSSEDDLKKITSLGRVFKRYNVAGPISKKTLQAAIANITANFREEAKFMPNDLQM